MEYKQHLTCEEIDEIALFICDYYMGAGAKKRRKKNQKYICCYISIIIFLLLVFLADHTKLNVVSGSVFIAMFHILGIEMAVFLNNRSIINKYKMLINEDNVYSLYDEYLEVSSIKYNLNEIKQCVITSKFIYLFINNYIICLKKNTTTIKWFINNIIDNNI